MGFFRKKQKTEGFPFEDQPNTACIVCRHILSRERPVLYASHDAEDGMWQFMCGGDHSFPEDAGVIGLSEILDLDTAIAAIAKIPCGFTAERESDTDMGRIIAECLLCLLFVAGC